MTLDRINELTDFYGIDVALVGGALHRGDLAETLADSQSVQMV